MSIRNDDVGELTATQRKTTCGYGVTMETSNLERISSTSQNNVTSKESNARPETELIGKDWSKLSHVALSIIFSHLSESDRLTAQFVCKQWYDVMRHSACLWRTKSFKFSGREPRDLTHAPYKYATQYIRTFGKYLQKLEFRLYSPVSSNVCKKFQKSVKVSVGYLIKNRARLIQLSLPVMQLDRAQWMLYREDMCASLAKLFCKGQHTLEEVCLRGARASFDDGYKVLYAMGYNTGRTIMHLDLEDFFSTRTTVFDKAQFVDCFRNFSNLRELDLNYSYISEELLHTLAKYLYPNSLKRFYIKVYTHDPHNQIIWGEAWAALSSRCPNLEVNMLFQRVMTPDDHFRILLPQIPLTQVTFDGCYFADPTWQLRPTIISILPYFKDRLRRLAIDMPDTREVFENELLELVQHCKNLTYLKINAFIGTQFVDKLLSLKQQLKCSITTLKVRIYARDYNTYQDEEDLNRIYDKYVGVITNNLVEYNAVSCVCL